MNLNRHCGGDSELNNDVVLRNNNDNKDIKEYEPDNDLHKVLTGDLYVIGNIWIDALKIALLGVKLLPSVNAAKVETPQKPSPMKYKELPLYQSPHFEYKDHLEQSERTPGCDVKLIHSALLPYVSSYRKDAQKSLTHIKNELCDTYKEVKTDVCCAFRDFKKFFRDPNRLEMRQAVVAMSGAAGFLYASKRLISRKIFYTTVGILAGGFLCFPEETDEVLRTFMYHSGKGALNFYNKFLRMNMGFRERLPCERDVPPESAKPPGIARCQKN